MIIQLRQLTMTVDEADDLADKLAALGWINAEIQEDVRKHRADERDLAMRRKGQ